MRYIGLRIKACATVGFVVLLLGVGAAGCGSSGSTESSASTSEAGGGKVDAKVEEKGLLEAEARVTEFEGEQQPIQIPPLKKVPPKGVRVGYVNCTYPGCNKDIAPEVAPVLGWNLLGGGTYFDPAKGPQAAAAAFEQVLREEPQYVGYVNAFGRPSLQAPISEAETDGVPLGESAATEPPEGNIVGTVGNPPWWEQAGELMAAKAIVDAGGATNIAMVVDPAFPSVKSGTDGIETAVEKYAKGTELATIKISTAKPTAENVAIVVNYLRQHPDTKYLLGLQSVYLTGVTAGLSQAGLDGTVKIIVFNPQATDFKEIENGGIFAGVSAENSAYIWRIFDWFARLSVGEKIPAALKEPAGWAHIWTKEALPEEEVTSEATLPEPPHFEEIFEKAWGVSK